MLPELLQLAKLFQTLYLFDEQLAKKTKDKKCPFCGGILDWGNYYRKPRGELCKVADEYLIRFSLCCRTPSCRKRTMPPSCRFLGRKVYWSCVILTVMAARQNRPNGQSASKLQRLLCVSHQTIARWIRYFRKEFPFTDQWRRLRGKLVSTIKDTHLPSNLLHYFIDHHQSKEKGMVRCLKFLASGHF
jgi:hypothetical protein